VTLSHNSATRRYTFVDTAETITLVGSFISPSGNGTHTVSFGDGNIPAIEVNGGDQNFTVNIEDTVASAPVAINLGHGNDTVNVSPTAHNLDNIQGAIDIYGPISAPFNVALKIYDQSNGAAHTFTQQSDFQGLAAWLSRTGAAEIYYTGVSYVTINAGNGNNTYNITGTAAAMTLNTGNGHDAVNLDGCGDFVVNEGTGGVDVDVGATSHSVYFALYGHLQVNGSPIGVDNLIVDDSSSYGQTYTLGAGSITFNTAIGRSISYNGLIDSLTIYGGGTPGGGTGTDTFNVQATTVPTKIVGNLNATVNVGDNGSVQNIISDLTITDPPPDAYVTLNVDDSQDLGNRIATLQTVTVNGASYGQISGLSQGNISYRYLDTSLVNVSTPGGGATVNVLATGVPVNLIGNSPFTTVNVGDGGSLGAIHGPLTITNPPAVTTVNVDDSADTTARTVTLDTVTTGGGDYGRITDLAPADILYKYADTSSVALQTGITGPTVNVLATRVPVGLVGHGPNTTVNVGNGGSVQDIQGLLTISNPPNFTTVNVDDSADLSARTVTLDTVPIGSAFYDAIAGLAPAVIEYKYGDTNPVTVEMGAGGAVVTALATKVPVNLVGNASGAISLVGNGGNTWDITGHNAGTLSGGLVGGTVTFSGVTNLTGGAGADTFVFTDGAGVDGTIDGGGGTNTLDYSAYSTSVLVDLQTGSATDVGQGIANIQNVTGGNGGGAGVYNILVGNGGNVLTGGDGRRNLLIAGASASTLQGGNDDDILIGGATAYDTEAGMVSLQAIMNYWSSTADDYATRVANLMSGNGVPLFDATVVTNNGGGNAMMGNHGGATEMNLFYGMDPTLETSDYNPASGEQFINC
jgi:hypothetical protein